MPTKETIMLRFTGGESDKGYQVTLEPRDGGWMVNAANGRWGSTFVAQPKTPHGPVAYDAAKKIFDKTVKEKLGKGYKAVGDAPTGSLAVVASGIEERETGIYPQLLNPINDDEAEAFVGDSSFWAQEKFDGRRILLKVAGKNAVAINRKGLTCGVAEVIVQDAIALEARLGAHVIDGEAIGEAFFAFDLLECAGKDMRGLPYSERLAKLVDSLAGLRSIRSVFTAKSKAEKTELMQRMRREKREGIVFKNHQSPYEVGRPHKGGSQRKLKFWATVSCLVTALNAKRSVAISVKDESSGKLASVGNVTIPADKVIPTVGQLIETKYLYAYKGGSLFQPQFLRVRDDINAADTLAELKYKSDGLDSEEE